MKRGSTRGGRAGYLALWRRQTDPGTGTRKSPSRSSEALLPEPHEIGGSRQKIPITLPDTILGLVKWSYKPNAFGHPER